MKADLPPMRTGDQLACRGNGTWSTVIAGWTGLLHAHRFPWTPNVSHTAIVVIEPDKPDMVYEATSWPMLPDEVDGKMREGVQCHTLENYRKHYDGKIWHVPLKRALPHPDKAIEYWKRRHEQQIAYDYTGAVHSASPLRNPVYDTEDHQNKPLFCTAYWAYGVSCIYGGTSLHPDDARELYPKDAIALPMMGKPVRIK